MSSNLLTSQIGQRIFLRGHFDVPVVLEDARPLGSDDSAGFECRVRLPDGSLEEAVISGEEVAAVLVKRPAEAKADTPVDAEKLRLLIESTRIRLAYAHDKQFAVSLSGIRTLPHQIEAVYQAMLPQPRLRFLLADDPGAGKTIMAGLLVKELKLREAIERILILCPAPLTIQWQDEMHRWFGEAFDIIFSAVDQQQLTNPWQRSSQIIASIDYAKQEDVRERVWQQRWDLVIIDEAHKCSARTASGGQNRESKVATTKRYDLASRLTSQADHVLLLTATPHHGDEDKFAHFFRLAAEDKVIEALIAEGFPPDRIERVGHLKLGFDIRAHKIADEATGEVFVKRIEVKGRLRGQPVRLTTNEWYKAQQLAETYWLYVVWSPLGDSPELVRIHNPAVKLDHAKREIIAARFYEIPAEAIDQLKIRGGHSEIY